MLAKTVFLPPQQFATAFKRQIDQVRCAASAFVETTDKDGLGRAMPGFLRDLVAIAAHCDLERLSANDGRRLAELVEQHRAALHRDYGGAVPAARIDAGITAAVALAGMIGKSWADLEAIPDPLLRGRAASATMLANSIENAPLVAIAAETEPHQAPTGTRLN